jgi:predicted phage tail component-like protein
MVEITYNGKGSYTDYGLILNYFKPQPPAPNIIKIDIPFTNGNLDFSTIGSMGEVTYQKRKIEVEFHVPKLDREALSVIYSEVLEWLLSPGEQQLIYSNDFANYYLAKLEAAPSLDDFKELGTLKLEFMAQPFKYKIDMFGDDIWDDFCFLTDYTAYTNQFVINGTTTLQIGNAGMNVTLIITSTANMTLVFEDKTYNLVVGDNNLYGLRLKKGINNLVLNGTGTITIKFREQFL